MKTAYNKVTRAWIYADPQALSSDWVVEPIFDDPTRANELGPEYWVFSGGSTIHVLTDEEIDVHPTFLAQAKIEVREAVNDLRAAKLYGGFVDGQGIRWNSGPIDIQNLNAVITLAVAGVITNNVVWLDFNNASHELTPAQLIGLGASMAVFAQTCYAVSWAHKASIDALTSVSAVKAYDFSTGWPI